MLSVTCRRKEGATIRPSWEQLTHQNQPPSPVSEEHPNPHCYLPPRKISLWLMMCFWFSESLTMWLLELLPDWLCSTQMLLLCLPHFTDSPGSQCWIPKTLAGADIPMVCKVILMIWEPPLNKQTLSNNKSEDRDRKQNIGAEKSSGWLQTLLPLPSLPPSPTSCK